MKDKRIWIVIGCILVIGSGVTYYTSSYVKSQGAGETVTFQAGSGLRASSGGGLPGGIDGGAAIAAAGQNSDGARLPGHPAAPEEGGADLPAAGEGKAAPRAMEEPREQAAGSPSDSVAPQAAAVAEDRAENEGAVQESDKEAAVAEAFILEAGPAAPGSEEESGEAAVPISPLTGARVRGDRSSLVVDYRQRLEDLDNQIQKMREEEAAENSSNVYSIKTSAETELKLWEGEVASIYNALLEMLSQEEAAALAAEQQEWLKNRELKANEGTNRKSGSVESLGYAATLASLTRERAYELAGRFEEANGITADYGDSSETGQ